VGYTLLAHGASHRWRLPLRENVQADSWRKRKRLSLALSLVFVAGLISCLVLRFVPEINDALSGPPEPMRYVAAQVASSLAAEEHWQVPVIVEGAPTQDCRTIRNARAGDQDQIYFVITYSERMTSFCVIEYTAAAGPEVENAITLDQSSGQNYGAPFQSPVRVVPVGHVFKALPDFVTAMLDWRTQLNRSGGTVPFDSKTDSSSSVPTSNLGLNLDLFKVRADAARKHIRINRVLDGFLAGFLLGAVLSVGGTWKSYEGFRRHCLTFDRDVGLWHYLRQDSNSYAGRAQQAYHVRQTERQAQTRAENLALRAQQEARQRLNQMLEIVATEQQRQQIEDCLARGDLEEMKALIQIMESQMGSRTPQERLGLLLVSLKDLCSEEEFQSHQHEAFEMLNQLGFRPAREFVVRLNDELREMARKCEENATSQEGADTPLS